MSSISKGWIRPKTKLPWDIYIILGILAAMVLGILYIFLGLGLPCFGVWFVTLAILTPSCTVEVPGYHALIVLDVFSGKQRVLFQGLNPKLPWEKPQQAGLIDLRTAIENVCNDTYATKDGEMKVKYVYAIKPNVRVSDAGANIILWGSFEKKAIDTQGRALFSRSLSDWYGDHYDRELMNKAQINSDVFGINNEVKKFEESHGASVTITLEDGDFDEATQKARDTLNRAESFNAAVNKLVDEGKIERGEATQIVKMMSLDDVTERVLNLRVTAPDLQNLRNVSILGGAGLTGEKKEGKKKK